MSPPIGATRAATTATIRRVIDDFEASIYDDKSNSLTDYYSGDTASATRQQSTVIEDSYSLELRSSGSSAQSIESGDGLPHYPTAGMTFRAKVQVSQWGSGSDTSDQAQLLFGVQNAGGFSDCYHLHVLRGDGTFALFVRSSGSSTQLASSASGSSTTGSAHEVEVGWGASGTITCRLFDSNGTELTSISPSDSTYTDGGIGWLTNTGASSDTVAFYDSCRRVA